MSRPESLSSSPTARTYATSGVLVEDVNVVPVFNGPGRFFRVGVAGDVKVECGDGHVETIYAVQVGETQLLQINKLIAVGTTAQKITVYQ